MGDLVPDDGQAEDEEAWLSAQRFLYMLETIRSCKHLHRSMVCVDALEELPLGSFSRSCVQNNIHSAELKWDSPLLRCIIDALQCIGDYVLHYQLFDSAQNCVRYWALHTTHKPNDQIQVYELAYTLRRI